MNEEKKHKTWSGSEALVQGALFAGASFLAGYPITPSAEIMHIWVKEKKVKFLQMEDEIASIHAVMGASLAGEKSFTATSGPGFSLMQEGLGMAFAMRIPLVLVNSQRQGPATGMPTIASQGDILQTQFGNHGDYTAIVFYPNSVKEMFKYIVEAFNASEECLSPVILLTDTYLTHLHEQVDVEKLKNLQIKERSLAPLARGQKNRHFTGLTSTESGEVDTLTPDTYIKWIGGRRESVLKTGKKYCFYDLNEKKNAKTLLISYGITSRLVEKIVSENKGFSHFRPVTLFPINTKLLKKISEKYENIVVIEMNEGQYAGQIQKEICREVKHIRVVGADPSEKDILEKLNKL